MRPRRDAADRFALVGLRISCALLLIAFVKQLF